MKKFKVLVSYVTYCTMVIEAENENEASEIAKMTEGSAFECTGAGDWRINDVLEIEE